MNPLVKGLAIAAAHVALVASLGGKLLYDRATLPRVWVAAAPFDPDLPIRGRYVSLQLAVEPRGIREAGPGQRREPPQPVVLRAENGRLVAEARPGARGYDPADLHVRFLQRADGKRAVLDQPVAFFIPEHVPDPSRRPPGEELWVLATIPGKGPPRPIRLGVRKPDGTFLPLELR